MEGHIRRSLSYKYQGGLLKEVTLPDGNTFRPYLSQGKLEHVENPRGIVTVENFFDENTAPPYRSSRTGHRCLMYMMEKKTVELTERNGSRVIYVHDDKYQMGNISTATGRGTLYYNQNNQKTCMWIPLGKIKPSMPDPAGNPWCA